ncbi:hypothetical protein HHK36_023258 [Tetracentron sinense]|uniref:Uncharacterized protein n=1 Tax=Tetracentron sinense TaxID=13715 RepID=A0A835D588_TETSI|nr:hypothetical protein HHK36_023258 [Tetracentron sinense]
MSGGRSKRMGRWKEERRGRTAHITFPSTSRGSRHLGCILQPFYPSASSSNDDYPSRFQVDFPSFSLAVLDLFGRCNVYARRPTIGMQSSSYTTEHIRVDEESLLRIFRFRQVADVPSPVQSVHGRVPVHRTKWGRWGFRGTTSSLGPRLHQVQDNREPGYVNRAGYGGYSGYGSSYTHPQIPSSAPPTTAYGAYPPTYPVQQATPQPNYVQPTTAVVFAPAQQQTPVPQAYYGNYY